MPEGLFIVDGLQQLDIVFTGEAEKTAHLKMHFCQNVGEGEKINCFHQWQRENVGRHKCICTLAPPGASVSYQCSIIHLICPMKASESLKPRNVLKHYKRYVPWIHEEFQYENRYMPISKFLK